jgi:hypothetical protein
MMARGSLTCSAAAALLLLLLLAVTLLMAWFSAWVRAFFEV